MAALLSIALYGSEGLEVGEGEEDVATDGESLPFSKKRRREG